MKILFFVLFFCVILIPIVLGTIVPIYKKHSEATGSTINYDATMRRFIYRTQLTYEQIVDLLTMKSDTDELSCTFDFDKAIIRFSDYGSYRDYYFQIQKYDNHSILRLEQVAPIGVQSHIPYKLNPFLVQKLQAEIIPFSQYSGSSVSDTY